MLRILSFVGVVAVAGVCITCLVLLCLPYMCDLRNKQKNGGEGKEK